MTTIRKHKFGTLDAMRGIAAIAVMTFHFRTLLSSRWGSIFGFPSGYLAVDIFFVLSGFVIAFSYDERLEAGLAVSAFLKARLIRLLPMIWAGVAIDGCFLINQGQVPWAEVSIVAMINATSMPNLFFGLTLFPTNGTEWSLFFEIIANFIFALSFGSLKASNSVIIILVSAVGVLVGDYHYGAIKLGYSLKSAWLGFSWVGFSFFLGVLICRTRDSWLPAMPAVSHPTVLLSTAAILMVPAPGSFRPLYDALVVMAASPILVMLGAAAPRAEQSRRLAKNLALLSFPLYAIHDPIRDWTVVASGKLGFPLWLSATIVVISLIPLSLAIALFYDAPVRRHLSRWAAVPTSSRA